VYTRGMHQHIFVFGNPDISNDALPLQLLPTLQARFPDVIFRVLDPNEEWDVPTHMIVLDTVINLDTVTTFQSLDVFMTAPRMTCHDFDAYANLMLLKKLGIISGVTVIGLPPHPFERFDTTPLFEALESALHETRQE